MNASVFYQDITNEFVHHYIELMKEDPKKTEPMYDSNVKLVVGKDIIQGHDEVCKKIQSMGKFELSGMGNEFCGQPYGQNGDVIITVRVKANLHEYASTFVLHEIESQRHRFAVILQIIHPLS
ncbi:hypothetical protein M9Y10_009455 [Tritrichomonas musculus]|uniref:Nuclear transport factor 2 domain-containing protein n=1 Tax=Tritrichomonas musculus TaxID=1915356 RepID=A0ABR2IPX1_9EUKA